MTLYSSALTSSHLNSKKKLETKRMLRGKKERNNDKKCVTDTETDQLFTRHWQTDRGSKGGVWVVHYATDKLSHRTSSPSTLNPAKSGITTIKSEFPHYTQRRGSVGQWGARESTALSKTSTETCTEKGLKHSDWSPHNQTFWWDVFFEQKLDSKWSFQLEFSSHSFLLAVWLHIPICTIWRFRALHDFAL